MKITNHKDQELSSSYKITADLKELTDSKNLVLKHHQKEAKIAGFRPGKAPLNIVEKNIDQNALSSSVLQDVVDLLYTKSIEELKIKPVSNPEIKVEKFVPFSTLEFTITVDKLGKITLPDMKNFKSENKAVKITAKDVDDALEDLRMRASDFKESDKAAKLTDRVTIDFEGIDPKDKKVITGTTGEDYPLILGSKSFIPGFEEELVGLKPKDKKSFDIVFPKDYGAEQFRNRKVTFNVTVKKIEGSILPKLDDELASKMGPFKTLVELKEAIKKELENELNANNLRRLEDEILNFLGKKTKVNLPEKLVNEEVEIVVSKAKREALNQGQTWEEYLKASKLDEAKFNAEAKITAADRVRSGIAIGEIAARDDVQVTREEFDQAMDYLKNQYKDPAMLEELTKSENRRDLMMRLLTDKVLKHLAYQVN